MKIQELLAELGDNMGLANVALDENGVCRLIFNDSLSIDFEADIEDDQTLIIHSVVGRVPAEGRLAFYQLLLSSNYLGSETGGAVLALDQSSDDVVLWLRTTVTNITVEQFASLLSDLITTAQKWIQTLANYTDESTASNYSADTLSELSGMIRI